MPTLLYDVMRVLLLLSGPAAFVCLLNAGIALRREGGMMTWFQFFGAPVFFPPGATIGTPWLASIQQDVSALAPMTSCEPGGGQEEKWADPGIGKSAKSAVCIRRHLRQDRQDSRDGGCRGFLAAGVERLACGRENVGRATSRASLNTGSGHPRRSRRRTVVWPARRVAHPASVCSA
jgi:hypothetical protein